MATIELTRTPDLADDEIDRRLALAYDLILRCAADDEGPTDADQSAAAAVGQAEELHHAGI